MKYWWSVFLFFFFLSQIVLAADWTFMVYLDGDNNLEGYAENDFNEMARVGSTGEVNILVQYDRCETDTGSGDDYYIPGWSDTRRFYITKGLSPDTTFAFEYGPEPELNMGDPDTLKDFIIWACTAYHANHYALVLWNHGGGWRAKNQSSRLRSKWDDTTVVPYVGTNHRVCPSLLTLGRQSPVSRVVCWDEDNEDDVLFMAEVREAIREAGVPLKIVGFDACLMGMLEVDYALRDLCDFVVASEEAEPDSGWPYEEILNTLLVEHEMSPPELAENIVTCYSATPGETMAAVDMERLTSVCAQIDRFADLSVYWKEGSPEWAGIKYARQNCSVYYEKDGCQSIDLYKFFELVKSTSTMARVQDNAQAVMDAISEYVIANYSFSGDDHGRAIYFPETLSDYQKDSEGDYHPYKEGNLWNPVDYVEEHQWDNFIWRYYNQPKNVPPGQITDLAASSGEPWSIELTWTAPGADGTIGRLPSGSKFRIDYSTNQAKAWIPEEYKIEIPTSCWPGSRHSWTITGLPGGSTYFFVIKAVDGEGEEGPWSEPVSAFSKPDTTPPSKVGFVNDGEGEDIKYVNGSSGLSANWAGVFCDPESGIASYWYAVGTTPGGTDVLDWTDNGLNTEVTVYDLPLQDGRTYYFGVKAKNGQGEFSEPVFSDGQTIISKGFLLVYPTILRPLQGEKLHIKYKIANEGRVQINVYNVAGEHIKELFVGERPVGENNIPEPWDGKNEAGEDVASGIYLIHISAAKFRATKKCALIK